jgi:DNA polymerase III gamma/tau subunit
MQTQPLYEQYRPKSWSEVIGQGKIVGQIHELQKRSGLAGKAYWLSGQSGTGKTTIARLIAAEIADKWYIEEIDATSITAVTLREIERTMHIYGGGSKSGRAFIINEAHGLNKATVRQLLILLEQIPHHVAFIFTTTVEGQEVFFEDKTDAQPLLSRCIRLDLARRGLAEVFAQKAYEIASKEGLNGRPLEQYVRLVKDCRNNMRAVLQSIENGSMKE